MEPGIKAEATVTCDSVIRTKDGSYCGNDLNAETSKSVDITALFRECDIRYKQRSFHNKGVKITENGDEKTSAPMRCSHESVSKERQ